MAALYLLDTNILIAALNEHSGIRQRLDSLRLENVYLSAIVLGELEYGAEKSAYGERNRAHLATLAGQLPLIGLDAEASRHYGILRTFLERKGTPIGSNDMWIAAQALAIKATLVTNNEREFSRVPGLPVENWLRKVN
ncbi:ribonuclease VapC [Brucella endophytica]|uniref:Ribonuclease VapC n=1 Tax=Brucella endophytica TaxID=1963359 RepID=A0A916SEH8_9HYPH|nr:PIN domain-containing protein [Brucella endophytica]GGA93491.1 ribonuclease VapC [Brucella endophytica]